MVAKKRRSKLGASSRQLGIDDWFRAARDELIENGILAVKADRLARRPKVSRGSFYWHFESHADFLEKLLASWMAANTAPFERVFRSGKDAYGKFQEVVDLWISGTEYNPKFDTAVRERARVSKDVVPIVRRADEARISVLRQIYSELGYGRRMHSCEHVSPTFIKLATKRLESSKPQREEASYVTLTRARCWAQM